MNTPKKPLTDDSCAAGPEYETIQLDPILLGELEDLIKALADKIDKPKDRNKAILLARLVENISAEDWLALAQQYNLRSWFALPLDSDAAKAISALSDTLSKLVFQRDHDSLTGLANRRYMIRFLKTEIERASRTGTPLSLLMLDLDRFKRINDNYGHLCGDKVLQKLGTFLLESRRSYDLVARYGGEEFVLILPDVSCGKARNMAERLLNKFAKIEFQCDSHVPFRMTFSGGVAGISQKTGYKYSPEELLKLADEAMYSAKRKGRNRIEISQEAIQAVNGTMVMAEEKQFLFNKPE